MKMLLCNLPFIHHDATGRINTGPNSGSRWPFTLPRTWPSIRTFQNGQFINTYAPYPFYLGYATSYLRAHDIEAGMYDGMAERHFDATLHRKAVIEFGPDTLVLEISTPVAKQVLDFAASFKREIGGKVVLVGPHCAAYADALLALPYVDHVVKGEYEIPLLKITQGETARLFSYEHVENLDTLPSGDNWLPYRDPRILCEYYDPTMQTPYTQLCISTSRGCAFHCHYCQWQKVINNETYRRRSPEMVIDEIRNIIAIMAQTDTPVRSVLFDDDTWNLGGAPRINALCTGLKFIGLPWSFLGRLDVHPPEFFKTMVDAGCVGMRFGVESFTQHVLDRTNGHRNAGKQYAAADYILRNFKGLEVHFTSMRDMPGQTEADWQSDQTQFKILEGVATANRNRMHYQVSRTMPFPGTVLHEQMVSSGHGDLLERSGYNGTDEETELSRAVRGLAVTVKGKEIPK